jgi:hypothetical protein
MPREGEAGVGQEPRDDVRGAEEWMVLSDALLAGLVHALNNRVTALSVCAELAALGDTEMMAEGGMLPMEVARLQRASALIGMLPARERPAEALELAAVLEDAIALHEHHPRMRAIACTIARSATVQPVRAPRWALLRLLLVFLDRAKAAAEAVRADSLVLRLTGDERLMRVHVEAQGDGGAYGASMASLCGGELSRDGADLVLTLPTLLHLRQRERSARAGE